MTVTSGGPATISSRTEVGGLPVDLGGLAALATQGDTGARDALLAHVRTIVHRYCRARLGRLPGSEHAADDVAQEVCLAVLSALPRYRDEGRPFEAFVFGIAAHKVADAQRGFRRSAVLVEEMPDQTEPSPTPEEEAMSAAGVRAAHDLLARLPPRTRQVLLLRAGGLSAEAVGQRLGMTANAVRVAQHRGVAKLRHLVEDSEEHREQFAGFLRPAPPPVLELGLAAGF